MSKRTITNAEMESRKRILFARMEITEAMDRATKKVGELTALEWLEVFGDWQLRILAWAKEEEKSNDD
ncbi:MAG: hypothetical protein WC485_00270 [Opitutaceae bacterium]